MKKPLQFDSKLKAYSAMALCFAGAGAANAQVVYTDVNPDKVITTPPDSLNIDFNNDATPEYTIKRFNWNIDPTTPAVLAIPAVNNELMASMGAVLPYVSALAAGTAINAAVTTWVPASSAGMRFALASTYSGQTYGNFNDGIDHFVGCKFLIGANTHFGWIRVNCVSGGGSATIKDYAYNATANTALTAGQGMSGIDDAKNIESNIYSFNKNIYLNFSSVVKGDINVYNSLGELIATDKIDGQKMVLNMSHQPIGIYMVKISSDKGEFVKKINL